MSEATTSAVGRLRVSTPSGDLEVTDLPALLGDRLDRLPHVLRLLAENHLRTTGEVAPLVRALDDWLTGRPSPFELAFRPNRLLMHDTTCTPALADIAGLRDALAENGADPNLLSPELPVDVSVDHSVAVDAYALSDAIRINRANEIARNGERYAFMKWASRSMDNFRVHPPGTGIMHTINLEQLATVLEIDVDGTAHPDMLLGTDSHTTMINGIGVLAWGIGGLEAESVMFGEATTLALPEIVGVRLEGKLPAGVLSTDLALEVTFRLREIGVAGRFVEFFGPGVSSLRADDRAVVANMAPEYGASSGFFPVDAETLAYLRRTARPTELIQAIEPVFRAMGLWFDPDAEPHFDEAITIDLSRLTPLVAGPRRPQDRLPADRTRTGIERTLRRKLEDRSISHGPTPGGTIPDGAVGIAAITSCTNTSDPRLLIMAGLLARKARTRGLAPPAWVKTSLAPGSPSAKILLERTGLLDDLAAVGFDIVGFGCTTCIGNSGALPEPVEAALADGKAVTAVLSGNRNFPGRVHPKLDLGYLASPPLVVAFALMGEVQSDILVDPIGIDSKGSPVVLADLWPTSAEVDDALDKGFDSGDIPKAFSRAADNDAWKAIDAPRSPRFPWDSGSRYLCPPKFAAFPEPSRAGSYEAQPLMVLGDDMTTDHISPAGQIDPGSAAGRWLIDRGADPKALNVYAAYRGHWEVMLRGLFTNRLAQNHLAADLPIAHTCLEDGSVAPLHIAAERLQAARKPTVILAGERYGMGSSRDWAAKGVALLGVRAVIARSFERIHRTNLIGMGVLPIEISDGFVPADAEVTPRDRIEVDLPEDQLRPRQDVTIVHRCADGGERSIEARLAVDTRQEIKTLLAGGVLPAILQRTLAS